MIQELIRFYRQRFHVPIEEILHYPIGNMEEKSIGKLEFQYNPDFYPEIIGESVLHEGLEVARISDIKLVLLFRPSNKPAEDLQRNIIDEHLPGLCRKRRMKQCDQFIEQLKTVASLCTTDYRGRIKSDEYKLHDLTQQLIDLSRQIETNRSLLEFFEGSETWLKRKGIRMFGELTKLVPVMFSGFRFENQVIIGVTQPVIIEYDGRDYNFNPYEIEVDMLYNQVRITGGSESNGYIHPHISDGNICWGNIGPLVNKLLGSVDLPGLFQIVHQFLSSYNQEDPYQKINQAPFTYHGNRLLPIEPTNGLTEEEIEWLENYA